MLTWDFDLLPVAGIQHSISGGAIEAPKSISGLTQAIDFSGGGFWKLQLKRVQMFSSREQHRAYLRHRAILDGGVGRVVIPLINTLVAPASVTGVSFSDGSTFSDGGSFAASTMVAEIAEDASLGAGTVSILVRSGDAPEDPDIFSIWHETMGWRAYQIREVDSTVSTADGIVYTVGIRPTLREAAPAESVVDFRLPRSTFRLPAGQSMPWEPEKYWTFTPSITFIEAMD